jgi:hypothetical protein
MEEQNYQLVLTKEEQVTCEYVAAGEKPHSQRARAILSLAAGASLAEVAAQCGLTENQVKLWRGRFRNSRTAIFPKDVLTAVPPPSPSRPVVEKPAIETAVAVPQKEEKEEKKGKKEKKEKKEKKKKKSKKDKKEKKNKKKGKKDKKGSKGKSKKKTK